MDKYISECPYCGGTDTIEAVQNGFATVTAVSNPRGRIELYHCFCRNCGSILRSYVKDPEELLRKKDRK